MRNRASRCVGYSARGENACPIRSLLGRNDHRLVFPRGAASTSHPLRPNTMRARIVTGVLAAFICSVAARAQTPAPGWILIVRMVQNPLPIGRCARIWIEIQDEHGYQRNELSNGGVVDFHKFRYDADTTNFQWQERH